MFVCSSKIAERMSRTVWSRSSTACWSRVGHLLLLGDADRALQAQPGGEEPLDDGVVEVAGDALAVLDEGEVGDPGVEAGVLDGDAGRGGEGDDHLLVDVAEDVVARLVAEVEVAEHLVAHPHRHTEERAHRRVVGREPVAVGVLPEVGEADRLGVDDEQPEDAVALRAGDRWRALCSSSMPTVMNWASLVRDSSSTPSAP